MRRNPTITIPWKPENDPTYLLSREWLITNGLGGYASGTVRGIATRRYHGLFVPDLPLPHGRTMMLPRLDDEIRFADRSVMLSGAEYRNGRMDGEGHRFLKEFRWEWQTPAWMFEVDGHRLEKRVVMPYSQNTVYVEHQVLDGGPVHLILRPYVTFRMHDATLKIPDEWPFTLTIARGRYEVHALEGAPAMKICLRPERGVFVADDRRSHDVLYRVEQERGSDHVENLLSPGYFTTELMPGASVSLVVSTEPWELLQFHASRFLTRSISGWRSCLVWRLRHHRATSSRN